MYDTMVIDFPAELTNGEKISLTPYQSSQKTKEIKQRKCTIDVGSMQEPDSLRAGTTYMIHKSEVGLWKKTEGKSPEDVIQTLSQLIPADLAFTFDIEESTAKGVGGYFHRAWLLSKEGKSDHDPIFIPWFEDENNFIELKEDTELFIKSMNDYDWMLWGLGVSLEGINWYKTKLKGMNGDEWRMKNENPSTDLEAFETTGARAFPPSFVHAMRKSCMVPSFKGDIFANAYKGETALESIEFKETTEGNAWIWSMVDKAVNVSNRYIVIVDIGGRSDGSDYSTINVLDRYNLMEGEAPERVFTWRGHLDPDLVVWKAVQIAKLYNNALLVIEENSLDKDENTDGNHFLTILDEIKDYYNNLYCRTPIEKIKEGIPARYGFHTNHQSRTMVVDNFYAKLRDGQYIERDSRCADECDTFERKPSGKLEHKEGCHDDILIPTAIGLWVSDRMPLPKLIEVSTKRVKKTVGVSTF
jgi:hypothetical protein